MKLKKLLATTIAVSTITGLSYAQETCLSESPVSISKIEKELKPLLGNAKPVSVSTSPIENIYEVILEVNGRKIPVYIDCSLNYLITGEIIDVKHKKNITRERVIQLKKEEAKEKAKKVSVELKNFLGAEKVEQLKNIVGEIGLANFSLVDVKNIPSKKAIVYGNKNSNLTIIVITDPECPFCKRLHNSIKEVLKDKNVKFQLIMYPLPFHKYAQGLSEAVVCQNSNEKSKKLLDEIFENQANKEKLKEISEKYKCQEGKDIIETHKEFAENVKVGGTPTMIFIIKEGKGLKISGAYPSEKLKQIIDVIK